MWNSSYEQVQTNINEANYKNIENALEKARKLVYPSRQSVLGRHPSVQQFWNDNSNLLINAWEQWDDQNTSIRSLLTEDLLDEKLKKAVQDAWENPISESEVKKLLTESSPWVFQFQMFNPNKLQDLRDYLDKVAHSKIPLRAPYGIALNRNGAMLDMRSVWYLAAPSFQDFYQNIMDIYMRPIARLLFPEIVWYDSQTYGFSIQYQPDMDTSLQLHTDASSVTMNVNLNLPGETFEGSEVDFFDPGSRDMKRISFTPGLAMIHRGNIAHAAQPITAGKRTNFVFWLYGNNMSIPQNNFYNASLEPKERWNIPKEPQDNSAPF